MPESVENSFPSPPLFTPCLFVDRDASNVCSFRFGFAFVLHLLLFDSCLHENCLLYSY